MSDEPIVIAEYELINCVATGTASQIWEVRQKGNPESLAMKLLLAEALADSEQKKVLKHEARVHQSLEHPNFLKFHKVEVSRDHGFILMEYFRAPNLKNLLYMDALAVHVRMRKLLEGLCLALQSMHDKGWVHRDIKPDNILFNKSSELKLIDFSLSARAAGGLAKIMGGKMRSIQGTRTYIAPETIRKKPATPQTDMYSLGVTLYEVLTGRPPFMGSSPNELLRKHLAVVPPLPSEFNTNVSQEFSRIIMRLLAKKPADRYKTMNEAYAEMRSVKPFKIEAQELADQKAAEKEESRLAELQEMHDKLDSRADHQRSVELGTGPKKVSVPAQVEPEAPKPPEKKPAAPQPVTASAGGPSAPAASQPGGMPPGGFPPGYAPQPGQQFPPGMQPPGQPPYPAQPGQPPWGWPGGMPPGQGGAMPPQQWPPGYYPQNPQQPYPGQQFPPGMQPPGMPQPGQQAPPGMPQPGAPQPGPPQPGTPQPGTPQPGTPQPGTPQPGTPQPQQGAAPQAPAGQPQPASPPAPQPPAPQPPAPQQPAVAKDESDDDIPFMNELPDVM